MKSLEKLLAGGGGGCPVHAAVSAAMSASPELRADKLEAAIITVQCITGRLMVVGTSGRSVTRVAMFVFAVVSLSTKPASAQSGVPRCHFLCAPELKIEPNVTFERLHNRARIETGDSGGAVTVREARESAFEVVLALGIPTEIPRVGFTLESIFTPIGESDVNLFTGAASADLGGAAFRDNGIEFEFELNFDWLTGDHTGGWIESHFDVVDKFSPAERPTDMSVYTHKLNFELDTTVMLFKWLPERNWLRNVELEGSLDYVATGLPRAGDVIGDDRYLDDASRWSFSLVAVLPVAPIFP